MSAEAARTAGFADHSLEHLLARLDVVAARVRSAVARRRQADPDPNDRFRGLYLPDAAIDELLAGPRASYWDPESDNLSRAIEARAEEWLAAGETLRLRASPLPSDWTWPTSMSSWSASRPTWIRASNGCTGTCMTTSPAAGQAWGSRSSYQACPPSAPRLVPGWHHRVRWSPVAWSASMTGTGPC